MESSAELVRNKKSATYCRYAGLGSQKRFSAQRRRNIGCAGHRDSARRSFRWVASSIWLRRSIKQPLGQASPNDAPRTAHRYKLLPDAPHNFDAFRKVAFGVDLRDVRLAVPQYDLGGL